MDGLNAIKQIIVSQNKIIMNRTLCCDGVLPQHLHIHFTIITRTLGTCHAPGLATRQKCQKRPEHVMEDKGGGRGEQVWSGRKDFVSVDSGSSSSDRATMEH